MNFDKDLPDHFFFKSWTKPKKINYLHPFSTERGSVNKDKVYSVAELEFDSYKIQICIDGESCWIKKC
jgi:hypothetical protein